MAFTNDDLVALETAIKSGAKTVKYADKVVEYHSLKEMLQLRDIMRKELGIVTGEGQRILASFKKGLNG